MEKYRTIRTSTGHKIRVRMNQEEVDARTIYRITLVALPFISSALMFLLWIKMG